MKKLVRNRLLFYLVFGLVYTGVLILIDIGRGLDIDLLGKIISGFLVVVLIALVQTLGNYSVFSRIKYLENCHIDRPSVKGTSSSVIVLSQNFDFSRLKSEIANKWLITFSDDTNHVVKLRQKTSCISNSWGAAAWLKFDVNDQKIHLDCFPMVGIQDKEIAILMRMELEDLFETP